MPTLSIVYPWPAQGRADRPVDHDDIVDVAIRGCRSIAELYGEALAGLGFANRSSELRLFFDHDPDLEDVRCTVEVDPGEGFEMAHVFLPTGFAARSRRVRAHMLLDAVHGLVSRLAVARGWNAEALVSCRQHVLDKDLEYRWSSAPKVSPDRRLEACADFRLDADGYGRVRLRLVRRDDGSTVASSGEALAYCTGEGFRRAARSLRWQGKDRVSMVPYDCVPAIRGGELSLSRDDDSWIESVADYMNVWPVPEGDPALLALPVHVEGRGATAGEQPPRLVFVGGGPLEHGRISRFHDAFGAEMDRFTSPAGQTWWAGAGLRLCEVQITYAGERARVRGRLGEHRLRVFVDQPHSSLSGRDAASLATEVAGGVVALVRKRTGLGPHPEFPSY